MKTASSTSTRKRKKEGGKTADTRPVSGGSNGSPKSMSQYQTMRRMLGEYWTAYGGWRGILRSPYFHLALIATALCAHLWLTTPWWDTVLSIIPNLLGFSLAAYALLAGFGDERFRTVITGQRKGEKSSPFMAASATFLHFVLTQAAALIAALVTKALDFESGLEGPVSQALAGLAVIGWALGFLIFVYSVALAVAAGVAVFRLSTWYDRAVSVRKYGFQEEDAGGDGNPVDKPTDPHGNG